MIGDRTLIGMGAVVLDGARIGKDCIIGAGSLVTKNTAVSYTHLDVYKRQILPFFAACKERLYTSSFLVKESFFSL